MAELTSQTTFTIADAPAVYEETVELAFLPENEGVDAVRELRYPGNTLPPLIYETNPDVWENFDTGPLTARPIFKGEITIADFSMLVWPGYQKDVPVKEIWKGTDTTSRMSAYMLRRLWEYFSNPPASGYITWSPQDRIDKTYNIVIENLEVAGTNTIQFSAGAVFNGFITGEVTFTFRIVGEVA